jgi:hypothetical protein
VLLHQRPRRGGGERRRGGPGRRALPDPHGAAGSPPAAFLPLEGENRYKFLCCLLLLQLLSFLLFPRSRCVFTGPVGCVPVAPCRAVPCAGGGETGTRRRMFVSLRRQRRSGQNATGSWGLVLVRRIVRAWTGSPSRYGGSRLYYESSGPVSICLTFRPFSYSIMY